MDLFSIKKKFKFFTDLKFAIAILILIAIASSLGSFIEQDEEKLFYIENYPIAKKIYGFIDSNFILSLGIDHVYQTWWFLSLLILLGISLISCTISRQFPIFKTSKSYYFKQQKKSFINLNFFVKFKNFYYLKERIVITIQKMNFYIYQKNKFIYGYKGLIGRISPILVHFSLILILVGSTIGAFTNFKAQEMLPKGEIFHIQNPIKTGWLTTLPDLNIRINDFWVEYEKNQIHQFYSNLSILDNYGNEIKQQTISVNNPLKIKNVDIYQSDWNLIALRGQKINENKIYEFPIFQINKNVKNWITWINIDKQKYTIIIDQLKYIFSIYDENGKFINNVKIGETIDNFKLIDIIPSSGLLIKYDISIKIIYFGFGLLMITSILSYLPYTQIWIFEQNKNIWIGAITNRGKIQLEIDFENLIRNLENTVYKIKK